MGMGDYLERSLLRWIFRNTPMPTPPATVYIGLHVGDPGDTGANEVSTSGTSYARAGVSTGSSGSGAGSGFADPPASGTINTANLSAVTFPAPTGTWGTVSWVSVWDAASGGNLLTTAALSESRLISNGDGAPRLDTGTMTFEAQ